MTIAMVGNRLQMGGLTSTVRRLEVIKGNSRCLGGDIDGPRGGSCWRRRICHGNLVVLGSKFFGPCLLRFLVGAGEKLQASGHVRCEDKHDGESNN